MITDEVARNNYYNKSLKRKARELRKEPTKAESKLWQDLLRGRQCLGYRFLRQRPIDHYIVDFFSKELQLIVEVDGYSHQLEEVAIKDKLRELRLRELGYSIIRFHDSEVMQDFDNVVRTLESFVLDYEESLSR